MSNLSKSTAAETLEKNRKVRLEIRKKSIEKVLVYLEERFFCSFPEGIEKLSSRLAEISLDDALPITEKSIDAIMMDWRTWSKYVSPESFQKFVKAELISICRIGCAATSTAKTLSSYIGNKAVIINELPFLMSTCININGTFKKDGDIVKVVF